MGTVRGSALDSYVSIELRFGSLPAFNATYRPDERMLVAGHGDVTVPLSEAVCAVERARTFAHYCRHWHRQASGCDVDRALLVRDLTELVGGTALVSVVEVNGYAHRWRVVGDDMQLSARTDALLTLGEYIELIGAQYRFIARASEFVSYDEVTQH